MSGASPRQVRCAIYTRKSSEEGLDQAFNSLDAQREAGEDFIKSQRHQGWTLVPTRYDDGGYSGGSMERPGLKALMEDISRGRIDIVLVYKVDRLSRSLSDFARLMQVFDERHVSFVSVTQQFNTTTSMGRLTLNMLLSFAQFEREVAGERIRDKIAATKRKGVWVGGKPPIGYRLPKQGDPGVAHGDRTLRVIEAEAKIVRLVFAEYLATGSPLSVARRLNQLGHSPAREGGRVAGGSGGALRGFTAQDVNRILTNPIYIGKITHRLRVSGDARGTSDGALRELKVYDGTHAPIVDLKTWQRVRERMDREQTQARQRWTHTHLLKGKLRTFEGFAMSPGSVQRPASKRRGQQHDVQTPSERRRVRYYMSQKAIKQGYAACPIKNVNATYIDDLVRAVVIKYLAQHESIDFGGLDAVERDSGLREVIRSVVVGPESVRIELDSNSMAERRLALSARELHKTNGGEGIASLPVCLIEPEVETGTLGPVLTIHMQIKRHDGKRLMLGPDGRDLLSFAKTDGSPVPREHIVRAIGQAFAWREELLRTGGRINDLARAYGYTDSRFHRLLELTNLAPDVIRSALSGEMSGMVSLGDLLETAGHPDWNAQRKRTVAPR